MARPASLISLVLLVTFTYNIYLSSTKSTPSNNYPPGSLACKMYEITKMDCSNRDLLYVPALDQSLTTMLNLSHNGLMDITNGPFEKLSVMSTLDLSNNKISQLASAAFRGLQSLKYLHLQVNKLVALPKDIFTDLPNLVYLDMNYNLFTAIPGQVLAPLHSLQSISFLNKLYNKNITEIDVDGFQNLTNLNHMELFVLYLQTNISGNTFRPWRVYP